jgi:hypothetical protein
LTTFDEHAVPVAVGGPHSYTSAVEVAEPEQPVRSGAPVAFQAPAPRGEPAQQGLSRHDDTADLPGLGVRRRSSKRGGDGRSDSGAGQQAARAHGLPPDGTGAGSRDVESYGGGTVDEPVVDNGGRDPIGDGDTDPTQLGGGPRPGVFEVPRRASKRSEEADDGGSGSARDRTVLRMEPSPSGDSLRKPATPKEASTSEAERNAQAARERLARFQRAVRQGRAQTGGPLSSADRNGGDSRDA